MRHRTSVKALVVGLAAVTAIAGCGREESGGDDSSAAPGITDTTIKVGSSFPLSGPLAGLGTAARGGVLAYLGAVNDAGGVTLSDGVARQIELVDYDDGYDPARAVQNYQRLVDQDEVFGVMQTFGTATNLAIMERAQQLEVPHVFTHSGAPALSGDQEAHPWTVGWRPTYAGEGAAYGEYFAAQDRPLRVAVLSQNDDLGEAYLSGFEEAIEGSQVEIVAEQTYEPSDATLDSQITNLASSDADVLFSAVAFPNLQTGLLKRAREIGWSPTIAVITITSSIQKVVEPAGVTDEDDVISANFVKAPDDPQWAEDDDVAEFVSRMEQYSPDADPQLANAAWGYGAAATLVAALEGMEDLSRQGLMDSIHQLEGEIPMLLPGVTLDGTSSSEPPIHGYRLQEYADGRWNLLDETGS
ncbi:ABC transporter substrate-binding protein [Modestobacter lapidis]|nr:ABC transporter substrate-binding protein [Modestobacter lapidis]